MFQSEQTFVQNKTNVYFKQNVRSFFQQCPAEKQVVLRFKSFLPVNNRLFHLNT